jgi:hypothetical protein
VSTAQRTARIDRALEHLRAVGEHDKRNDRWASDSALWALARAYDRANSDGPELIGPDVDEDLLARMRAAYLTGRGPQHLTGIPPLGGHTYGAVDGRYRLWTSAHGVQFGDLPAHHHGGPALVGNGWACRIEADGGQHMVRAVRGTTGVVEVHPLHGQWFATKRDADRAAYTAGLTAYLVYERSAAAYGLPTDDPA